MASPGLMADGLDPVVPPFRPSQAWVEEKARSASLDGAAPQVESRWRALATNCTASRQAWTLVAAVLSGSAVNAIFCAVWFGHLVSGPDLASPPPEGYAAWEACNCTLRRDVTALGAVISFERARVMMVTPRVFFNSSLLIIFCFVVFDGCHCTVNLMALVHLFLTSSLIALISSGVGLFAERAMTATGYMVTFAALLLSCPIQNSQGERSWCQALLLTLSLAIGIASRICLFSLIAVGPMRDLKPGVIYLTALLVHRSFDVALRFLVPRVRVGSTTRTLLIWHQQIQGCAVLRTYAMGIKDMDEVVLAGAAQCLFEAVCSTGGIFLLAQRLNKVIRSGSADPAEELGLQIFVQGIMSDMVCEHLALNLSFCSMLFLDTRLVKTQVFDNFAEIAQHWAVLLSFELLADVVVLTMLLGCMPPMAVPAPLAAGRSALASLYFLLSCIWINFPQELKEQSFTCTGIC